MKRVNVRERIEDAGLSRLLREAKRKEANAPTVSLAEVKKRVGMGGVRGGKARANGRRAG
jgi:hypothetical protein